MVLAPRWAFERASDRLAYLPIQPTEVDQASTLLVPVEATSLQQSHRALPRMRRTLSRAARAGLCAESIELNDILIGKFVEEARAFGGQKNFFVPPVGWFKALTGPGLKSGHVRGGTDPAEPVSFKIFKSSIADNYTQVLVAFTPQSAHYLFGYDSRASGMNLSTAASAHFHVLEVCRQRGIPVYDLNGYTDPSDVLNPYSGVSRFKSQFGGHEVRFFCPKFSIS